MKSCDMRVKKNKERMAEAKQKCSDAKKLAEAFRERGNLDLARQFDRVAARCEDAMFLACVLNDANELSRISC